MANHYDHNPFDEGVNPFSAAPAHASHSVLSTLPAELADYNHMYGGASLGIPKDPAANLRKKEKELQAKEAELVRREQEVKRREDALARAGIVVEVRNWPPFMPMIHHDIANDIPLNAQRIQYVAFATFLGMMVCLLWNVIAVTSAWIAGKNGVIFFLAIIYFLLGFLSYFSWYRPLYNAFRTDRAWTFGWFFLFYLLHIAYCIYAAVGPPFIFHGIAITGIFSAIDVFKTSAVAGGKLEEPDPDVTIFYFIGFAFFTAEALVSIWVLQQVYMYFRGSGRNISATWHANNGGGGVVSN